MVGELSGRGDEEVDRTVSKEVWTARSRDKETVGCIRSPASTEGRRMDRNEPLAP
jgi:hypothetical protein